jgi:DNA (cytosine-5)-methyltransferase 1
MSRPFRPTVVDCFSGAGGLSLGLQSAGFRPVFAFDVDEHAVSTYQNNIGSHAYVLDVKGLDPADIQRLGNLEPGSIDLVAGGPPCQGFSSQRRGSSEDSRNDLVQVFANLAVALEPKMILVENVPGLLGKRGCDAFSGLTRIVSKAGYEITSLVVDAADFGVPQRRRRAVVVAWDPRRVETFSYPAGGYRGKPLTAGQALRTMPEPPDDYTEHPQFANHTRVRMSTRNIERISHVPPGGGRLDIPEHLQLACHRDSDHRHLDVFGRMRWDEPAPTITAMFDNFTRGRFAHPTSDRSITGREGARLQSFPDSFVFLGPKKDVARQIGNAVPPRLAAAIGKSLVTSLNG